LVTPHPAIRVGRPAENMVFNKNYLLKVLNNQNLKSVFEVKYQSCHKTPSDSKACFTQIIARLSLDIIGVYFC